MNCECGFSRDACATNPCLRKKVHLAGLTPGSKWPEGAPVGESVRARWEVGKNGWDASDEATREDI